ncbi:1,2-phenylacetyl-CoA epoxidase subunit PaaC [Thioalkalivibrio sp. HK1]|uniref:1,2-phenylacetyl-CoA epoxidase subunit PaaC n=1 Tax=Thioalkalivibrio sp. HK1 TaxID=1469245 RepID=UPI0004709A73|nr:1,2-phenylacetyl-CoA epoxidase subunit PaaC [Thioalkalivibrio sp. HK1]
MTLDGRAANDPLFDYLCRLGDGALILGHRLGEWCGHAPALEEDIALANTALDLIGQAQLWLDLAGRIEGEGRGADDLAMLRDVDEFKNPLLVEQPNGDFGCTLMRQFLFDGFHFHLLDHLRGASDRRVADIAAKAIKEVEYHLARSSDLVVRLGDGTKTSRARMQGALDILWPFTGELFEADIVDEAMLRAGIGPDLRKLEVAYRLHLDRIVEAATLTLPEVGSWQRGGKSGLRHSEALGYLLAQMQWLQRAYPQAKW